MIALRRCLPLFLCVFALAGCSGDGIKPGARGLFDLIAPPTPAEAVEMATNRWDADQRYRGTQLLSNAPFAGEAVYLALFRDNANDKDPGVRAASIRALGLHGGVEDVPLLLTRLKDEDPGVRTEAARSLQRIHSPDAVSPLLDALDPAKEGEGQVRVEAASALGQYPQSRVVEALIAAMGDEKLAINAAVQDSLRTLTGQDFGVDQAAWQTWYKQNPGLFDARAAYIYPVFRRPRRWWEYLPFVPPPPNEVAAMPVGVNPNDIGAEPSDKK
ncbi:MAG: hypothetical protein GC200_07705 [Tepidisphaera sp.]|nr:hypothetical protein [Tepidisphaera sp.]